MNYEKPNGLKGDVPVVLSKWYDVCKWILAKVDSFPKNQRFIFGTRLADRSLGILETLVEAAYSSGDKKLELLRAANRDLAVLRWLIRMAKDRQIITMKQYQYARLLRCDCGVDFCGFVVFANGRVRVRRSTARRFHKRFRKNLEAVNNRLGDAASLLQSVAAWVGHVKHAQSWNLRKAILCGS